MILINKIILLKPKSDSADNIKFLLALRFGAFNAAGQQTAPPVNSLGQPLRIEYGNSVTDTFTYYDQNESWQKHFRIKTTRTADRNGVEYFRNDYGFLDGQGKLTNNITSLLDPRFGDQSFGYDYLNRLASATQSAPTAPDAFRQSNGSLWAGYGVHTWSYAKNGNITARTELSPLGVLDSFAYAYAGAQPHAVTGIVKNGGLAWGASYNQNGALLAKGSDLDPSAPKDHDYFYDAYDRLVAALDVSGLRLSDSFYHLGGARLFEGRLTQTGQVEGSLVINGGYELKLSSGNPVYVVKHIRVGGRAIGDVYEKITDWNSRGLGCGSLAGRAEIASSGQIILVLSVFSVPLCLIFLLSLKVFSGPGFHAHPWRNTFILLLLAVLAWELSPGSLLDFRAANPMHKQALYRTLKKLLPIVYGSATIPESRLTAEFFDNLKAAAKAGKIFGPRPAQAQADERQVLYYHSDHLGSTRLITLQSGEVYQYLNYLPFGKALEGFQQSSYILPGWAQSKRSFTGQEIDRTTGLMFYQSRFYDPEIGRFVQPDTAPNVDDDFSQINRYSYVNNNPLIYTDPTGKWIVLVILVVVTFLVLAGGGPVTEAVNGWFKEMWGIDEQDLPWDKFHRWLSKQWPLGGLWLGTSSRSIQKGPIHSFPDLQALLMATYAEITGQGELTYDAENDQYILVTDEDIFDQGDDNASTIGQLVYTTKDKKSKLESETNWYKGMSHWDYILKHENQHARQFDALGVFIYFFTGGMDNDTTFHESYPANSYPRRQDTIGPNGKPKAGRAYENPDTPWWLLWYLNRFGVGQPA